MSSALEHFSAATRAWFTASFAAPTAAQQEAWQVVSAGSDALVVAPTGSGKTLAAFLWAVDRLAAAPPPDDPAQRCRVLYVSPLKALAVDIERNLRAPLAGIRHAATRLGLAEPTVTVGIRSGDTPAEERRRFGRTPPDILITTPESLYLLLTSQARAALRGVQTVIVDEVHAVAATKRGAHLALSLERLDAQLAQPAQRIGLSATVRPLAEVASFLGGGRQVSVVAPAADKVVQLQVVVPVEDMAALGEVEEGPAGAAAGMDRRPSIWPAVEERIVDLVAGRRSTIVFVNSRRLAERLTARLNEIALDRAQPSPNVAPAQSATSAASRQPAEIMAQAGSSAGAPPEVARAHHGSVSKEQRAQIENDLKMGRLRAVVATSSLELGVDMGAVDLVIQVEPPPSVASGMQRVGRAGHSVGEVSRGVLFPKHRGDLLPAAVIVERMAAGAIESLRYPRNPLDVLAQQVVAMVAMEPWQRSDLAELIRRAAPFAGLPQGALDAVLDMLAGRYPGDEFAALRPRLRWDRVTDTLSARPGAQRLAVTSGGTIPDRGLFGVFLLGERASRVGELDEEMVYESRVGDVFTLGSTSWRIEEITADRVLVSPAPGQPGKLPFWHGDAPGRPVELGRAVGRYVRQLGRLAGEEAAAKLTGQGLDEHATRNLLGYLAEQRTATGHVPDDRTIVIERFRDELGDWRLAVHSPFGAPVHAPWALALRARLRERLGLDVATMHTDDGIVLRLPDTEDPPSAELIVFEPDDLEAMVRDSLSDSALFASRFRECAARALLLPRRSPGRRSPLWQQRQRSAQLLSVVSRYPSFPIVLETMRECLQDVFDVPGLTSLMRDIAARSVRVVEVETAAPSPFARSLLFRYVAAFMYEGDAPLAERRAQALSLDRTLLAELLGQAELRELLDPDAIEQVEVELQRRTLSRRPANVDSAADLFRVVGDLDSAEAAERGVTAGWLAELAAAGRILAVRIAGAQRWIAVEDAARVRDALGVPLPMGVPTAFLQPVTDPLGDVVGRYARTHAPFTPADVARRLGVGVAVVDTTLQRLAARGRVLTGEFRPGGSGTQWCDAEVLRLLRRRSLAALRQEAEPVPVSALVRFLPSWQGAGTGAGRGVEGVLRAVEQLQGAAVPASALETLVLPARVREYAPAMLDEVCAAGEVVWAGAGALPGGDGWVSLYLADAAPLLLPAPADVESATPISDAVLAALDGGAALFFRSLADRVRALDDDAVLAAVWDLVWAGQVTNDTLTPLRAVLGSVRRATRPPTRPRSRYATGRPRLPSRTGPPSGAGRWSLVPDRDDDLTRRRLAVAETLLDRHGVVTRGAVTAEQVPGGFAAMYPVLKAFEESGRCRRGYFIDGLGGAQFAAPGAVDRLRGFAAPRPEPATAEPWQPPVPGGWRPRLAEAAGSAGLVLAAADPANPYGAALPWPTRPENADGGGHRPGRKAGALVVTCDGDLVLYVERGGKTLLSWTEDPDRLSQAARSLAAAAQRGGLGRLAVERADGTGVLQTPLAAALADAGFAPTPRGLRLRASR
jgi:ATP-dependent helicase Lhr and Lhr-like helicase